MQVLQHQTILDYATQGAVITVTDILDTKQQSYNAKKYIGFDSHINTNNAVNVWFNVSYKKESIEFKNIPFQTYEDFDKFVHECKTLTMVAHDTENYLTIIAGDYFKDAQECIKILLDNQISNDDKYIDQHSVHITTKNLPNPIRHFINDNRNNLNQFL
jgi:hypothetical protein